ncbi:MAG TPA: hypothetical protein VI758_00565, partial [Bacteroidota bacterium]
MPAALLLALSYYCLLRSAWKSGLLFASLVFLFRFEMSIFAVVVILAALRNRKFSSLPVVLIGPLTWFVFSWATRGKVFAFVNEFIAFSRFPKYIEGATWGHYFTSATDIFGTVQIGLLVILFVSDIVRRKMSNPILYGTVAYCFAINTFASSKEMNWTGSVGDLRYLVPVAPFVGILALNGLAVVVDALRKIPFSRFVPHILSAVIIYEAVVDVKPHHLSPFEQGVMKLAVEAASDTSNTPILSNHWAATFALLGNKRLADRVTVLSRDTLIKYPRAYILWDPLIANSPFSQQKLSYADVRNDSAVTIIDSIVVGQQTQFLFLKGPHKIRNPLTRGF